MRKGLKTCHRKQMQKWHFTHNLGQSFFVRMSSALYSVHRIKGIDVSRLNPTAADV